MYNQADYLISVSQTNVYTPKVTYPFHKSRTLITLRLANYFSHTSLDMHLPHLIFYPLSDTHIETTLANFQVLKRITLNLGKHLLFIRQQNITSLFNQCYSIFLHLPDLTLINFTRPTSRK